VAPFDNRTFSTAGFGGLGIANVAATKLIALSGNSGQKSIVVPASRTAPFCRPQK